MLIDAAKPDRCPEREKHVFLFLDEMHIREDLNTQVTLLGSQI